MVTCTRVREIFKALVVLERLWYANPQCRISATEQLQLTIKNAI